jgi:hypothetical protein
MVLFEHRVERFVRWKAEVAAEKDASTRLVLSSVF